MGMESYTVLFLADGAEKVRYTNEIGDVFYKLEGDSKVNESMFYDCMMSAPFTVYVYSDDNKNRFYVVNGELELELEKNSKGNVIGVRFRGCFAWYYASIEKIYNTAKYINDKLLAGRLFGYKGTYHTDNYDVFRLDIIENVKEKYDEFVNMYGAISKPVIASEFDEFLKKKNNKILKWKSKYPYCG